MSTVAEASSFNNEEKTKSGVEGDQKKWQKPKEVVTYKSYLTIFAHASVLVFVYLLFKLAFRYEFEFFTWHPLLLGVGWSLLMTEGFFAINKYNTHWRVKTQGSFRLKLHVIFLSLGLALSLAGFIVVYLNKIENNRPHFATWHSRFGLCALLCSIPPLINGTVLWYKKELALSNPKHVKIIHILSGSLAFTFGSLSLILSVYSNWYRKRSDGSHSIFYLGLFTLWYPLGWALIGPTVKVVHLIRDSLNKDK